MGFVSFHEEKLSDRIHGYFRAKVIQPINPLDLGDLFDFDLYTKILDQVLKLRRSMGLFFKRCHCDEMLPLES